MVFSEYQIEELAKIACAEYEDYSDAWRDADTYTRDYWRGTARAVAERAVKMAEKARQA